MKILNKLILLSMFLLLIPLVNAQCESDPCGPPGNNYCVINDTGLGDYVPVPGCAINYWNVTCYTTGLAHLTTTDGIIYPAGISVYPYTSYSVIVADLSGIPYTVSLLCPTTQQTTTTYRSSSTSTTTVPSTYCVDTDHGHNYYVKGNVYGQNWGTPYSYWDYCSDGAHLIEYFCFTGGSVPEGAPMTETISCPCSNGACIYQSSTTTRQTTTSSGFIDCFPTCTDTDGGMSYYTKGSVHGNYFAGCQPYFYTDSCKDSTHLLEWYCSDQNCPWGGRCEKSIEYSCPCSNGACLTTTTIKTTIKTIRPSPICTRFFCPLGLANDSEFYMIGGIVVMIVLVIIYGTFKYFAKKK